MNVKLVDGTNRCADHMDSSSYECITDEACLYCAEAEASKHGGLTLAKVPDTGLWGVYDREGVLHGHTQTRAGASILRRNIRRALDRASLKSTGRL